MTHSFAVLFSVPAGCFVLGAASEARLSARSLLAAAGFTGLSLATRWSGLATGGFLAGVLVVARGPPLLRPRAMGPVLAPAAGMAVGSTARFRPIPAQPPPLPEHLDLPRP